MFAVFYIPVAQAATFTVTNINDSGPGSFRQAVLNANTTGGSNTIGFQSGLTGTIILTGGQLTINNNLTIQGPGAGSLAISGNRASRIFSIASGVTVAISGLSLLNGYDASFGGAISNAGNLTIANSTLANNAAGTTNSGSVGGAVSNGGALTITNSTLSGNLATYGGCIDNGKNPPALLTITNSILSNNSAYTGGCIYNSSALTVTITNNTLANNSATENGGGIYNAESAGTLDVRNSTLSRNTARGSGGGIYNRSTLVVSNSTLSGNAAMTNDGGGLWSGGGSQLTVSQSTLSNNSAATSGGGLWLYGAQVTITNTTLSGNTAKLNGASIYNAESGSLQLLSSVLFDNTAAGSGGGIYNRSMLVVSNSTLSGNTATANDGGGLWSGGGSQLTVSQSTLSDNSAGFSGGGLWLYGAQTTISNSVVSGNAAPRGKEIRQDNSTAGGVFNSQGHNLFGENRASGVDGVTLSASDLILAGAVSTALSPLANNGGTTLTHLLVTGGPASNAGNNALIPAGTDTDQRGTGFPRLLNGTVDIGAVEVPAVATYSLTINKTGMGTGIVTGNGNYAAGTMVKLTAKADTGSTFAGWSPSPCAASFAMPADDLTCTATFNGGDPATTLITHYYTSILERSPDSGGLAFWKNQITQAQILGQDAKPVFRTMATQFFNSPEYLGRNTTNTQYITNLYFTFFQRAPDSGGMSYWMGKLAAGMSRNTAMNGFLYSNEFTTFMQSLSF